MNKTYDNDAAFQRTLLSWHQSRRQMSRRAVDGFAMAIALSVWLGSAAAIEITVRQAEGFDLRVIDQMLTYFLWTSSAFLTLPFTQYRKRGREINVWISETVTGAAGLIIGLCCGLALPVLFRETDPSAIKILLTAPILWIGFEAFAFVMCSVRHLSENFYGPLAE
ncbi:hypothetical protein [Brucella pituitosa]|uniref:Uncharacterized protein n=1 Tax=Brucella pituitosa TaxID=571256 RepID=A0A643ESV5_9HYPH|nr:hypothetical protein [Brucella pituitosa]KAB0565052.1 hypothetical protein F7Q93_23820 [Brucella pituitosa]